MLSVRSAGGLKMGNSSAPYGGVVVTTAMGFMRPSADAPARFVRRRHKLVAADAAVCAEVRTRASWAPGLDDGPNPDLEFIVACAKRLEEIDGRGSARLGSARLVSVSRLRVIEALS